MNRERIAMIVLITIILLSAGNLLLLNRISARITDLSEIASAAAQAYQWDEAEAAAEEAVSFWDRRSRYLQCVLHQNQCDRITDALGNLQAVIYNREAGSAKGAAQRVQETLDEILDLETPSFSSVLTSLPGAYSALP